MTSEDSEKKVKFSVVVSPNLLARIDAAAEKARDELFKMIDNDENNLVFKPGDGAERSTKRKKGKKKKKKKKDKEKSS